MKFVQYGTQLTYVPVFLRNTSSKQTRLETRVPSSGMLRRVTLVITDVSEGRSASNIGVTRIGEPRTTLAVTSNRRNSISSLRASVASYGKRS
jgi:hypothetical protein